MTKLNVNLSSIIQIIVVQFSAALQKKLLFQSFRLYGFMLERNHKGQSMNL